jgi:MFS family permease
MVQISCYSIITFHFSYNRDKYLGMAESAAGLGLMLGPVIGSLIYGKLHYMYTFLVFTGILLVNCIVIFFLLPSSLNDNLFHD